MWDCNGDISIWKWDIWGTECPDQPFALSCLPFIFYAAEPVSVGIFLEHQGGGGGFFKY